MGCHAGVTPIVNGVKKRTPLPGEGGEQKDEYKKAGGYGGRRVNPTFNSPPPLFGFGEREGGNSQGIQLFCVLFFL
jgi:hypothetical protein